MRLIEGHKVNPANDTLRIEVQDNPGSGGASHAYQISGFNLLKNPVSTFPRPDPAHLGIVFQNGPIAEVGVNGITHEALIAILIDRLEAFQNGAFRNQYNAAALGGLKEAQESLLDRTRDRMARNVEGTHSL